MWIGKTCLSRSMFLFKIVSLSEYVLLLNSFDYNKCNILHWNKTLIPSFIHSFIHSYNFIIHLFCKIMSGINFMHQMQWFPLTTVYPKNSKSKYPPLNSFPSYFLNSIIKSWKYLKISSFSDVNKVYFLKVSKSWNQFMVSWILP